MPGPDDADLQLLFVGSMDNARRDHEDAKSGCRAETLEQFSSTIAFSAVHFVDLQTKERSPPDRNDISFFSRSGASVVPGALLAHSMAPDLQFGRFSLMLIRSE
jgi:hypothetical protein